MDIIAWHPEKAAYHPGLQFKAKSMAFSNDL